MENIWANIRSMMECSFSGANGCMRYCFVHNFSQACHGNIQLFPVFSYGFAVQYYNLFPGASPVCFSSLWGAFVFLGNDVAQDLLHLTGTYFFPAVGLKAFAEENLSRYVPNLVCTRKFTVGHPADGGNIKMGGFCNVI